MLPRGQTCWGLGLLDYAAQRPDWCREAYTHHLWHTKRCPHAVVLTYTRVHDSRIKTSGQIYWRLVLAYTCDCIRYNSVFVKCLHMHVLNRICLHYAAQRPDLLRAGTSRENEKICMMSALCENVYICYHYEESYAQRLSCPSLLGAGSSLIYNYWRYGIG